MTTRMTAADGWAQIIRAHTYRTGNDETDGPIGELTEALAKALDTLEALNAGIHWEVDFPGLDSDDPEDDAKQIAADDVSDAGHALKALLDGMSAPAKAAA